MRRGGGGWLRRGRLWFSYFVSEDAAHPSNLTSSADGEFPIKSVMTTTRPFSRSWYRVGSKFDHYFSVTQITSQGQPWHKGPID